MGFINVGVGNGGNEVVVFCFEGVRAWLSSGNGAQGCEGVRCKQS